MVKLLRKRLLDLFPTLDDRSQRRGGQAEELAGLNVRSTVVDITDHVHLLRDCETNSRLGLSQRGQLISFSISSSISVSFVSLSDGKCKRET